jgi:photosynthetic reaction center H subunit
METGAITQGADVAQIVLYMFWAFFAGVIYYLVRENHREGYPLDNGQERGPVQIGWPVPDPKTYKLEDGRIITIPDLNRADGEHSYAPSHGWLGAPLEPVGDPLLSGMGPGAWAAREDICEKDPHGDLKIVPLRAAPLHGVSAHDHDPRGLSVYGADGLEAGRVKDLWVDRMEMLFRYIEVSLTSGKSVLLPVMFARITDRNIQVHAILSSQFDKVPALKNPDQITRLEEEKISAFYGAGTLYATPERQEPLV